MASPAPFTIPNGYTYDGMRLGPYMSPDDLERIRYELNLDDTYVISASAPKTGSTWVCEILYLLLNNCDPNLAMETSTGEKFPFLEMDILDGGSNISRVLALKSPRLVRTHLPARYFERHIRDGGAKVVVTMRNPKDKLVSLYHFYRMHVGLGNYTGTWDDFFELHKTDCLLYEDFFKYYSAWMKYKKDSRVLFVKYEDLHKNTEACIAKMATFLGKTLNDDEMASVIKLSSFSHMGGDEYKNTGKETFKEDISKFFRKGKVGDWKNYFSLEQSAFVDEQCRSILSPLGLEFQYE